MATYRSICVRRGKFRLRLPWISERGPLQQAQTHIAEHGLSEQIKTRLSDGMAALQSGEADTILIAGMGGGLVMKILSEGAEKLTGQEELILQPQSEITLVREFLRMRNFQILDEDMILEDGKYYPMMKVIKQKAAEQTKDVPQNVADAFGPSFVTETASGSERMAGARTENHRHCTGTVVRTAGSRKNPKQNAAGEL